MNIVYKRLDELKEDKGNPRKITRYQLECLKESLRKWGFRSPINIAKDGTIIGGHQRIRAARELGWKKTIPCKVDNDLSGREVMKLNLALNNITGQSDSEKMKIRLNEIGLETDEIKSVGFDHVEIEKFSFDKGKDQPEIEFVQELLERHSYVVLVFDNEVDWLNLVTLYPLPKVKSIRGRYETKATARVISGSDFLNHILAEKWREKDIIICAPSYKRPDKVETLNYIPSLKVFVAKSEHSEYKKNYLQADIVAIPDKVQGNISKVRNFILDYLKGTPVICIVDDDLKYIAYWENGESHPLALEKEIYDFIYKYSVMAMDLGVHLWGINIGQDPKFYSLDRPFSLVAYIGAPFGCHLDQDLRYDERLPLKEDYDFALQQLNVHRRILRINKFYYVVRQAEQAGGCATYRNLIAERNQFELLQKKWGKRIVKGDTLKTSRGKSKKVRRFDINPVIYPPIKGT